MILAAAALIAGGVAQAAEPLSVDFQSDMPGMAPKSASYVSAPRSTRAEVVDSASDPADPFGGKDNKCLLLEDQDMEHNASAAFLVEGDGLTRGHFSMKLVASDMNADPAPVYGDIRLGEGPPNVTTIGPWIDFNGPVMRVQTPNGELVLDNLLAPDVVHTLTIDFDTAKGSFTGSLDGKPLTSAGKTDPYPFYAKIKVVNAVGVDCAFSTRTDSRMFVDDLKLTSPKPAKP
jgi:hypothetical protein